MILAHTIRAASSPGLPDAGQLTVFDRLAAGLGREDWPVDVAWVEDPEMAGLNARYRNVEGVTDVLSFGNLETEGPPPASLVRGEKGAFCDLYRDPLDAASDAPVGDLVIAPAFVRERCLRNGWDPVDELNLLIVHGLLHLLGWDHMEPEEARRMRDLETTILSEAGLSHPMAGS